MFCYNKNLMLKMSDYLGTNYRIQIHHLCHWAKSSNNKKNASVKVITRAKHHEVLEKPMQKFFTEEAHGFLKSIFIMIQE